MTAFAFDNPADALRALLDGLRPVETESVSWSDAAGRVLAQSIETDRDSPPHDVSAMDGYAVRLADLDGGGGIPVAGEVAIGRAPPPMPAAGAPGALRIFTGACIPAGAEAVIRREDVDERPDRIALRVEPSSIRQGQNIRFRGENLAGGRTILQGGAAVTAPVMAALAAFGVARPRVFRRVRAAALVTGDELLPPDAAPRPWQIRDSNGPTLHAAFARRPWIDWRGARTVGDDPDHLTAALGQLLDACDAVLLSGGVSMGDYDHVPRAVEAVGGAIVFHKLPLRPGKPILTAIGPAGQAILALPGNPVSVMCTAVRFGLPALRRRAGFAQPEPSRHTLTLDNPDDQRLNLWWYRPVRRTAADRAELIPIRGSGDLAAAAQSDGLVELPPDGGGPGPWPYHPWVCE